MRWRGWSSRRSRRSKASPGPNLPRGAALTAARRSEPRPSHQSKALISTVPIMSDGFQVCRLSDEIADGEWLATFLAPTSAPRRRSGRRARRSSLGNSGSSHRQRLSPRERSGNERAWQSPRPRGRGERDPLGRRACSSSPERQVHPWMGTELQAYFAW
jgi:hypothetical protein